jgi:hypothetical protein
MSFIVLPPFLVFASPHREIAGAFEGLSVDTISSTALSLSGHEVIPTLSPLARLSYASFNLFRIPRSLPVSHSNRSPASPCPPMTARCTAAPRTTPCFAGTPTQAKRQCLSQDGVVSQVQSSNRTAGRCWRWRCRLTGSWWCLGGATISCACSTRAPTKR